MVDLVNMRVTPLHPEASDYRPTGQPDAPIPNNSIDVHLHVRNDTYGLSAVGRLHHCTHFQILFLLVYALRVVDLALSISTVRVHVCE